VLGLPFLYLFQLGGAFLVGTLNSRFLMIGFIFEAAVNIFFDYSLIRGRLGFAQMGFNGAAIASAISEFAGMIVVFAVIIKLDLHKRFGLFKKYMYNRKVSKELLIFSAPLVLQFVLSLATWLIFFIMIEGNYNADDKAISNIMRNVFGLAGVFVWAFANTTNTIISNLVGQGRQHEVMNAIKKIMLLSCCAAVLMAGVINIFPNAFFKLFGQGNDFVEKGIPVLRVASTAMLLMSISIVWLNSLTGTGQTKINLMIEIVAIVLYLLYTGVFIKILKVKLLWAWSNEWIYWISIFSIAFIQMNKPKWKQVKR
jgi:Na+-driven multidrug efflux pump